MHRNRKLRFIGQMVDVPKPWKDMIMIMIIIFIQGAISDEVVFRYIILRL